MNFKKDKILTKFKTLKATLILFIIKSNVCFAESIGTEEVQTATDNI